MFRSTILQPFQFDPEQEKTWGNDSQEEETKHIYVQVPVCYILEWDILELLHIRVQVRILPKPSQRNRLSFFVERWMQCLLLGLKSQSAREAASRHPAYMGNCLIISHTCQPDLSSRQALRFVPSVAERIENTECEFKVLFFLFLVLIRWNEEGRWV